VGLSFSASEGNKCVLCGTTTTGSAGAWVSYFKQTPAPTPSPTPPPTEASYGAVQSSQYCSDNWIAEHGAHTIESLDGCKQTCGATVSCTAFSFSVNEGNKCVLCGTTTTASAPSWDTYVKQNRRLGAADVALSKTVAAEQPSSDGAAHDLSGGVRIAIMLTLLLVGGLGAAGIRGKTADKYNKRRNEARPSHDIEMTESFRGQVYSEEFSVPTAKKNFKGHGVVPGGVELESVH